MVGGGWVMVVNDFIVVVMIKNRKMETLTDDLKRAVASFLTLKELWRMRGLSQQWRGIVDEGWPGRRVDTTKEMEWDDIKFTKVPRTRRRYLSFKITDAESNRRIYVRKSDYSFTFDYWQQSSKLLNGNPIGCSFGSVEALKSWIDNPPSDQPDWGSETKAKARDAVRLIRLTGLG